MMGRHRSTSRSQSRTARDNESRQREDEGRTTRQSTASRLLGNLSNNMPRSPRSSAKNIEPPAMATPPPTATAPPPIATPPPSSSHPRTRCYRLNLEKPFDISQQKSPLGRDYSGPPVHDSDLPPAQGPVEYIPPMHLCTKEEMAWRRHSWGGALNSSHGGAKSVLSDSGMTGMSTPSELLATLHVSVSEESSNSNAPDPTSIAISTARIFRGIVVDRSGVITSMNSRATRSRSKNGTSGAEAGKNKMGEKSRQAAKIEQAKDLIDEAAENGGAGGMSDQENDPSKIVSLFVMGEYDDFTDFVRDGSKKLIESKELSDETIFMYNTPRPLPPNMQRQQTLSSHQPMTGVSPTNNSTVGGGLRSPSNSASVGVAPNSPSQFDKPSSPTAMSPTKSISTSNNNNNAPPPPSASGASSPMSNLRKRVFSSEKSRSRYKQVAPRSAPPKLKSHTREATSARSSSRRTGNNSSPSPAVLPGGYHRASSQYGGGGGAFGCNPTSPNSSSKQQQQAHPNYFQQQCNFFPGNSNWTEAFGLNINSLWNCGANGGHMSPTMTPNSHPTTSPSHSQHPPATTGGGGYHGSGAAGGGAAGPGYSTSNSGYATTNTGYHQQQQHHDGRSSSGYNNNGGYSGYSTSAYHGPPTGAADEGRNPSYGYGRGPSGAGVRDTVIM